MHSIRHSLSLRNHISSIEGIFSQAVHAQLHELGTVEQYLTALLRYMQSRVPIKEIGQEVRL